MSDTLRPWFEGVRLHPDVESGKLSRSTFAIDFGGVLADSEGIPLVYRDARSFWQATHLTSGVKRLLEEVLSLLNGGTGDRVLQLRSPFGGGKSHVLVALYHSVKDFKTFQQLVAEARSLPNPGTVRIAGIDGEKFDPVAGTTIDGTTVHTLWGALAVHLKCFDLMKKQEEARTAPGGEIVKQMLGDQPTLILLDEVLRYVERAMGIPVGDSNLGRQSLEFLQTLTTEVAGSTKSVIIYSLQASGREALENIGLLNSLDHLAGRVDAKREPVAGDEILDVLKKRLLQEAPNMDFARRAGDAIANEVTKWRTSEAPDDAARRIAQDEKIRIANRLQSSFPFHVSLIDLMKERWASINNFQRTRGALRFLAAVLHKSKALGKQSYVVGPGDIPLEDADVRNAFFTEVGQREDYQAVLEHDLTGQNARAKRIDTQLAQQNPALSLVRPATRMATAILMYSFGGIQRQEGSETLPPGVTEKELLEATLGPDLDSITAQSVLKRLREECLYLHFDGVRYCFKTTANINKLVEDENIHADDIRRFIHDEIERRVASVTNAAVIWPQDSSAIPDREPRFMVAYLPLEFSEKPEREKRAISYLTQYGTQHRLYRNAIGLAIPDKKQIEGLRAAARNLLAVEAVKKKKATHRLTKEQLDQLREREATEQGAFESSLRRLYNSVWLLKIQDGQPAIDPVDIGSRPMKEQGIHERIRELLEDVSRKVFTSVKPAKIVELMRIGKGDGHKQAVDTKTLRDAFFQSPDFPRVSSDRVLMEAIATGIQNGTFGYALKNRVKEENGKYFVKRDDAIINRSTSADEIDIESGYIFIPECVVEPEPGPVTPGTPPTGQTPAPTPIPPPTPSAGVSSVVRRISIEMKVTKQSLYKTFNALGNLAEKAGEIKIHVHAEKPDGMDKNWLRNAVKEPLEEGGVDAQVEEE
jgi:hypothetical protein